MNILIFGATGMVGQGALREALLDPGVDLVRTVGRNATGQSDPKLRETVVPDPGRLAGVEGELSGFAACFFCLGVSSAGMSEEAYRKITYDLTLAAAATLVRLNPQMVFVHVTGAGTDSTEKGRAMWARVKGATENALLRLPFRAVYLFRPGGIEALHGIQSRTRSYRFFYRLLKPFLPVLRLVLGRYIVTTETLGHAMLAVVRKGYPKPVLEIDDIKAAGGWVGGSRSCR